MGDTSIIKMLSSLTSAISEGYHVVSNAIWNLPEYKCDNLYDKLQKLETSCFIQIDSNTSCGWGGIAGQAFTNFWMVVIEYPEVQVAAVFIGRCAYVCKIDEFYKEALKNKSMPFWDNVSQSKISILWKPAR